MVTKTGIKETNALLLIYSLTPVVISLVGIESNLLSSGAIVNHVICFFVSMLMLKGLKRYFNISGDKDIMCTSAITLGRYGAGIICLIFFFAFFQQGVSGICIASEQISSLALGSVEEKNVRLAIVLCATILSYLGIEALTRHSYVTLFLGYLIIGVFIYASINGWRYENLFPVFGTSLKKTFTGYVNLSMFSCVAPLLFVGGILKDGNEAYRCIKKTLIISFVFALILILIYTLTVPYPVGKLYSYSLEAIFSSGSSGDILHRFEIFLIVLFTLFSIIMLSFNFIICSRILRWIWKFADWRPLVLISGVLTGCVSGFEWTVREYIFSNIFLAFLSFFIPLILSLPGMFIKRRTHNEKNLASDS